MKKLHLQREIQIMLLLIVVLAFTSFQDGGRIRYFQPSTLVDQAESVIGFPSMSEGVPDTLYQIRSESGFPLAYYKKIFTGVCFDNECRMLDIVLYWNITGRYLGFELPEGEFLSKYDHEPFNESEYERLHALLADLLSPLGMYAYNELAPKAPTEEESVDGMTSATTKDILEYVVEGAAFTTYTLRNLVYGPLQKEIKDLTRKELSQELFLKILKSPDVSDKVWALAQVSGRLEFTPELQTAILRQIDNKNYSLAERAIQSINSIELESVTLQRLLLDKFYESDYGLQKLLLDKFKEAPQLDDRVKVDLARNIGVWEGALLTNLLDLYTVQKAYDIETCRMVSELLQNENSFISQKAFSFLKNADRKYEEIDQELETYKANQNRSDH